VNARTSGDQTQVLEKQNARSKELRKVAIKYAVADAKPAAKQYGGTRRRQKDAQPKVPVVTSSFTLLEPDPAREALNNKPPRPWKPGCGRPKPEPEPEPKPESAVLHLEAADVQ